MERQSAFVVFSAPWAGSDGITDQIDQFKASPQRMRSYTHHRNTQHRKCNRIIWKWPHMQIKGGMEKERMSDFDSACHANIRKYHFVK